MHYRSLKKSQSTRGPSVTVVWLSVADCLCSEAAYILWMCMSGGWLILTICVSGPKMSYANIQT